MTIRRIDAAGIEEIVPHTGTCGLCHLATDLRDSHFLPAALYKLCRAPELKNPNPVLIGGGTAIASSEQVRKHFLCEECEKRFCNSGEKWLLANCLQTETEFPLCSSLLKLRPEMHFDSMQLYSAFESGEIDDASVEYFALSVFWRAAATDWPGYTKKELGPYEEPLRQYLLGGPFPDGVALIVIIAPPGTAKLLAVPPLSGRISGMNALRFAVPGIIFALITAKHISEPYLTMSLAPSKRRIIGLCGETYQKWMTAVAGVTRKAEPKGSLIRFLSGPDPRNR